MQQFSHDYTKVREALESLYSATRLIANECYDVAIQRINNARTTLSEHLAKDNMVPDIYIGRRRTGCNQALPIRADGHDIRIISQLEFKEICSQYLKK